MVRCALNLAVNPVLCNGLEEGGLRFIVVTGVFSAPLLFVLHKRIPLIGVTLPSLRSREDRFSSKWYARQGTVIAIEYVYQRN